MDEGVAGSSEQQVNILTVRSGLLSFARLMYDDWRDLPGAMHGVCQHDFYGHSVFGYVRFVLKGALRNDKSSFDDGTGRTHSLWDFRLPVRIFQIGTA